MRSVERIIYINLDHRIDRQKLIQKEFDRLKIPSRKIHRLSGVYDQLNGIKGCLLSHIQALELAEEKGWENCLILEDDSLFITDLEVIESHLEHFYHCIGDAWDVFFLGGTYLNKEKTKWDHIIQVLKGQCSHAYLIRQPYYEKLKACFHSSYNMIKNHIFASQSINYPLDRVWNVLQKVDRWYALEKQCIIQRIDQSDVDVVLEPFNRFMRIVYIDTGNEENLLREFKRLRINMKCVYRTESQLEAIECAKKVKGSNTLIIEDRVKFPRDLEKLGQIIAHFFKWAAYDWEVFLFDSTICESIEVGHPYFKKVTKIFDPLIYVVNSSFYETLHAHYKKGEQLNTLPIKPETLAFCPLYAE